MLFLTAFDESFGYRDIGFRLPEKKEYRIKVQGQLVPVSEEIYFTYYGMKRCETYPEERDTANGVFYYNTMDTTETTGENGIPDLASPRVEDLVVDKLIAEKLHGRINQLASAEQELIHALFFRGISERQYTEMTGG